MKVRVKKDGRATIAVAVAVAILLVVAAWLFARGLGAPGFASGELAVSPQPTWADYSWEELADLAGAISACENDDEAVELAARYGLCDERGAPDARASKDVTLAGGRVAQARIVGIRADTRTDGGLAGLTFALVDAGARHAMNHGVTEDDAADGVAGGAAGGANGDAADDGASASFAMGQGASPVDADDSGSGNSDFARAPYAGGADGLYADSVGGWAASDMRSWLNGEYVYSLPADLRGAVVPVQKRTASTIGPDDELDEAGKLAGAQADWVGETSDALWLFSASELCGSVPARADLGVDETMSAVYAGEGAQYRLFADADVKAFEPNGLTSLSDGFGPAREKAAGLENLAGENAVREGTAKSSGAVASGSSAIASSSNAPERLGGLQLSNSSSSQTWWLRTKTLEFGDGFWLVGSDGTPLNGLGEDARVARDPSFAPDELWGPDHPRNLVVGFCL